MKYLVILFFICLFVFPVNNVRAAKPEPTLTDGWYYASVAYYNYATYTSADYTLKVKVKDGMVIIIYLSTGGTVHWGVNEQHYMYTGGKLKASKDKHSDKIEYETQVSISNGSSISSYTINILKGAPDEQQAD